MAQCRFDVPFPGPVGGFIGEIRSHVARAGGRFDGSTEAGTFSLPTKIGTFRGTYEVVGTTLVLSVSSKPFLVPCLAIEAKLSEYLRSVR